MEWLLIVLLIGAVFFSPLILAIVALSKVNRLSYELAQLRKLIERQRLSEPLSRRPEPATVSAPPAAVPAAAAPIVKAPTVAAPRESIVPAVPKVADAVIPKIKTPTAQTPVDTPPSLEITLGGKAASFIGIATLVMGVVFFVGYAIQRQWIGPGLRILMGLATGGLLVVLGYLADTRGRNLRILARALTGGGAALFYFSVFAAYGIYQLIGAVLAGAGLVFCAGALLALAALYSSEVVAVLGVLGAFITPLLIGGDFGSGSFPLFFIAIVNVPVILLGLRRGWQWLYNLSFMFTVLFSVGWLDRAVPGPVGSGNWVTGLAFIMVFFAEFVALGLIKLRAEPAAAGRWLDCLRLLLAALGLLAALKWILAESGHERWVGFAFIAAALLHVGLARAGWIWYPRYKGEILTFLVSGLTFASLALPEQLDGVWVSAGWSLEGLLLAWFALRIRSRLLQFGAIALGLLGLFKPVIFDIAHSAAPPALFLTGRFIAGFLGAVALGAQGWLQKQTPPADWAESQSLKAELLLCAGIIGGLIVLFTDAFSALPYGNPWTWLLTSAILLVVGVMVSFVAASGTLPRALAVILLFLVPIKLVLFDLTQSWPAYNRACAPFANFFFWLDLMLPVAAGAWIARLNARAAARAETARFTFARLIISVCILALIIVVSVELNRIPGEWPNTLITIWWSGAALALAVTGLLRRAAYLRYLALLIFAVTVAKVFLVDLAGLRGLQRVAALIGAGLLLLVLSFAYQKVAPLWLGSEKREPPP